MDKTNNQKVSTNNSVRRSKPDVNTRKRPAQQSSVNRSNSSRASEPKNPQRPTSRTAKSAKNSKLIASRIKLIGFLFCCVLVLVLSVSALRSILSSSPTADNGKSPQDIAAGVNYIKQLENVDVITVQNDISNKEAEKKLEALKNGDVDVWSQFSDSVIIGDSRAVGFYYYDFLPEERVLAMGGASLYQIPDWLEQIQILQPKYVFICLGINDIGLGAWNSDEYAVAYKEAMESIWEVCPNCTIYPNSTLLAIDPAFEQSTAWYDIPEYNEYLKAMCDENDYPFVDNDLLCEQYRDLYQPDGIHMMPDFYEPWAYNMLKTVMEYEDSHSE